MVVRVLIAGILGGKNWVSIHHAVSILEFQRTLATQTSPRLQCTMAMFQTLDDAVQKLRETPDLDVLIAAETHLSLPAAFVMTALTDPKRRRVVLAKYALPGIDWKKVNDAGKAGAKGEDLVRAGMTWNAAWEDLPEGTDAADEGPLRRIVQRNADGSPAPKPSMGVVIVWQGVRDEELQRGPMYVDIEHTSSATNEMGYVGCLGTRRGALR